MDNGIGLISLGGGGGGDGGCYGVVEVLVSLSGR
jgi:hypothetical protein